MSEFDYVIVGGGSAGCVLAARLSEDPRVSVCLIEAGPVDKNPLIHIPAGLVALVPHGICNWAFETVPQPGLGGRRGYQPRGRTLGGSSSINAMIYIRGHPRDYDQWEALGNPGWGWTDVLPYFRKAEGNKVFSNEFHGTGGPLDVANLRSRNPLGEAFVAAAEQAGFPRNDDFNGAEQEGCGPYQVTQRRGRRCSTAKAYVTPHLKRPNLTVMTGMLAQRVLFEGRRAVGAELRDVRENKISTVKARGEVILSAGAFQSPQLLMLSGIGDGSALKQLGIDEIEHLPGVGRNLQDHIDVILNYRSRSRDAVGVSPMMIPRLIWALLEYRLKHTGLLTTNFAEAGGFVKSDPSQPIPDIQFHFAIAQILDHARKIAWSPGLSLHVCALRPQSRGSVQLNGRDPRKPPLIDPGFLTDPEDMVTLIKGVRHARRIMAAPAMAPLHGPELGSAKADTDAQLEAMIRARADTIYHPVGTCRMGHDSMSVVDTDLRVRGVEGLRVVDASIMPTLIGGNTNAPTIMIAEKAADTIKAAARTWRPGESAPATRSLVGAAR